MQKGNNNMSALLRNSSRLKNSLSQKKLLITVARNLNQDSKIMKQVGPEGRIVNSPEEVTFKGEFVLFNNRVCPFGHRAWWSLEEKGVKFDYIHIDLGPTKPEWYAAEVNPSGTVPCIYDDSNGIFESLICAEYVEDNFPDSGSQLMPKDPKEKAAIRLVINTFGEKVIPFLYKLLMNVDESKDDEIVQNLQQGLKKVNGMFKQQSKGPYFLGDRFSLADLAIVPFLDRFSATLPHWRGFTWLRKDDENVDRLAELYEACKTRPAFQKTSQAPEFYCTFYESYAKKQRAVSSKI